MSQCVIVPAETWTEILEALDSAKLCDHPLVQEAYEKAEKFKPVDITAKRLEEAVKTYIELRGEAND